MTDAVLDLREPHERPDAQGPGTAPDALSPEDTAFLQHVPSRAVLTLNLVLAVVYFAMICFAFQHGNALLFWTLAVTEVFHLFQIASYVHTVWATDRDRPFDPDFDGDVDVFITVCGEPVDVVRRTALAALAMEHRGAVRVHLLNDGLVARKADWRDVEVLAEELGVVCFTRTTPGGAKAGNINHALARTTSPFVVVFDADHVPAPTFLAEVMGYFTDERMGFVQTPQYYANHRDNRVTRTAWQQQTLFFGPIMSGKSRVDSAFMCGTNMAIRRTALADAGGMCETSIAEDFLTSLLVHDAGWRSVYVPKVLAQGLAPDDFLNYYKQQFRWTRGSLEVVFSYNPLLRRGLSWGQRLQYLSSAAYYLSGVVVLASTLLPVVYLLTGQTPIVTSTMTLALVFLPYIWLNLFVLQRTSASSYSFQAISFSLSSWWLQLTALVAVLTKRRTTFAVTSKDVGDGGQANFLRLVLPNIAYAAVGALALAVGLAREGLSPSLIANAAWLCVHVAVSVPFVLAAAPRRAPRPQGAHDVVDLRDSASTARPVLEEAR
ncbi:glycosyltransferase [Quadrisphaera oryzae]|uniref:glycosyltransferase n=1 Tax=Quadrisphaera TaxID=317661 RepID=UPI00164936C9|nr:glycosyltransferase [Quadrisphaera sp. RL12-1S]